MPRFKHTVVIGLGYVGLPLAQAICEAGGKVTGVDASPAVVDGLNSGTSHIDDIPSSAVQTMLDAGFVASLDPEPIRSADSIVICVPTPLNKDKTPDLSAVDSAVASIVHRLQPRTLVVLESTTYPGTTDGPVRERLEASGLIAGRDFWLAFSPERIDPGNKTYGIRNTPKVVGGVNEESTIAAAEFYSQFVDTVVPTVGTREAEMAKLLENTYRHVNIALVNEMAIFSHDLGINLWAAIDAAKTKPFGFQAFYPGPGVGGHCIPIDPNYLSYSVRTLGYQFRFVELAEEISGRMPVYVVARAQLALNDHEKSIKGSRIALLGLTYKSDISDERETPSRPVASRLLALGANVVGCDPYLERFEVDGADIEFSQVPSDAIEGADLVILLQKHEQFDLDEIAAKSKLVLDTRGVMNGASVVRL